MQENSLIKQNILKYLDFIGITRYQFYKETGITRGILDQNNGMSEENTARFIAYYPDISVEWLITGKGDMLKKAINEDEIDGENEYITKLKVAVKPEISQLEKNALEMIVELAAENALLKEKIKRLTDNQ